jgi:peptide/nickel transport system substrate-binding protein
MTLSPGQARALGRIPLKGALRLVVPWRLDTLDPHSLFDPVAAMFGHALCDTLYQLDERGRPYPVLAQALPEPSPRGARLRLRPNLATGAGRALSGHDVVFSLERAKSLGAAALLAGLSKAESSRSEPLTVVVPGAEPEPLARALSSPLTAIVPRGYSQTQPDGTGAFRARFARNELLLERNMRAARGPSYLERVEVSTAVDLADSLRAFEAGDADVSWLGTGLHRPRVGAVAYDAGLFGWMVLRTGRDLGAWGAPGVMQEVLDSIPAARVAHLGLRAPAAKPSGKAWAGPACDLLVLARSPYSLTVARTVAAVLGSPGHEVRVVEVPAPDVDRARSSQRFSLLLDFVRPLGPPRDAPGDVRLAARTLPLGVLGELHLDGAFAAHVRGLAGFQLGDAWDARVVPTS